MKLTTAFVSVRRAMQGLMSSRLAGVTLVWGISVAAWLVARQHRLVLAYNDSMSHLNIARRIIDNMQPGLAQIGTVWLPLNHILYVPIIWNDWAWRTGFAGSAASMSAFVAGVIGVYYITKHLAQAKLPAVVAASAFALNLNLLYVQTTPLTETVFLALLVWSVYCFVKYVQLEDSRYLIGLGTLAFFLVLSRYDGWVVAMTQSALVFAHQLRLRRGFHVALGRVAVMAAPAIFAVFLWVLWNASLGSPWLFLTGHGSAKAQQDIIASHSGLYAQGHPVRALAVYISAMVDNIGLLVVLVGALGASYFLVSRTNPNGVLVRWLILMLLLSPVIFNILALYLGFSVISLPEFSTASDRSQWFNVRYGLIALPAISICYGLFARWGKVVAYALLLALGLQAGLLWQNGLITVADGTRGSSAFTDADIAQAIARHVHPNQPILMSFSQFNPVALADGLPLRQFIHEGVSRAWQPTLDDPTRYVQWIVVAKNDVGDPVYDGLRKTHHNDFQQTFHLVFTGEHADLYERNGMMSNNRGLPAIGQLITK